jgi:putative transposase
MPVAVTAVREKTVVQACTVRLLRKSFRYASKDDWSQIAKDIKLVYTTVPEAAAIDALSEFSTKWEKRYPAITRLWENTWQNSRRSCSSTVKYGQSSAPPTPWSRSTRDSGGR